MVHLSAVGLDDQGERALNHLDLLDRILQGLNPALKCVLHQRDSSIASVLIILQSATFQWAQPDLSSLRACSSPR